MQNKENQLNAAIKPVVLIILDGFGLAPDWGGNAKSSANMPNYDYYWRNYPHSILQASAENVGLPPRTRGNSETGHLNLGAGKIVRQDYGYISSLIRSEHFFSNKSLNQALDYAEQNKSKLNILGLIGDGGIHSHSNQLFAIFELLRRRKFKRPVALHLFTDGRDTAQMEALSFISQLQSKCRDLKNVFFASISGRYYAMDRDNRWERTSKAWQAIALGRGQMASSPEEAVSQAYRMGLTDEFIVPTVITNETQPVSTIEDNDSVIFFNFRPDRARQLTTAFMVPDFKKMQINKKFENLCFVTFVQYEEHLPTIPAFLPEQPKWPLVRVLSDNHLKQFHTAETEKYAHVTYFFNGGREDPYPGEDRLLIPSPKVATYDLKPEMSAYEVTDSTIKKISEDVYDFIVINYANPDMVGHTGNFAATIKALEVVDECLGRLVDAIWQRQGAAFITADHGNAEEMINPNTGAPDPEHTDNPVPLIYLPYDVNLNKQMRKYGILADVAPTILEVMKVPKPVEMSGISMFDLRFNPQYALPKEQT